MDQINREQSTAKINRGTEISIRHIFCQKIPKENSVRKTIFKIGSLGGHDEYSRTLNISQCLRVELLNRRQGDHKTLSRSEISKSTRKLRPQKKSGQARVSNMTATQNRGGAKAHGPKPFLFNLKMNKKCRISGLNYILYKHNLNNTLYILNDVPEKNVLKTKEAVSMSTNLHTQVLKKDSSLEPFTKKMFIITGSNEELNIFKNSFNNLRQTRMTSVESLSVKNLFYTGLIILTPKAISALQNKNIKYFTKILK